MLVAWSIFALFFGWKFGHTSLYAASLVAGCSLLLVHTDKLFEDDDEAKKNQSNSIVTLQLLIMSGLLAMPALRDADALQLTNSDWFPTGVEDAILMSILSLGTLYHFLRRVVLMDKLLPPTLATVAMIATMLYTGVALETNLITTFAILSFVGAGAYLAIQGEWRSGMRSVARREERLQVLQTKQNTQAYLNQTSQETGVTLIDPKLIELAEKQKKRAKRTGISQPGDLEVGDIQHRPTIVLSFLGVSILASMMFAFLGGDQTTAIILCASISILFISLARVRAESLNLRLVDVLGIEIPIAVTMAGLVLVHLAGRASQ
jgi:hypothetical protein